MNPIDRFLSERCFLCTKLKAKLTPEQCACRQMAEIKTITLLKRQIPEDLRANEYCASGECKQGRKVKARLSQSLGLATTDSALPSESQTSQRTSR